LSPSDARAIAAVMQQWSHIIYPIALIVLGLAIRIKGGALGL
jgi:cadmium resistance protein CadD (predicted permease)